MNLIDLNDESNVKRSDLTDGLVDKVNSMSLGKELYETKWMTIYKHYPDGQMHHVKTFQVGGPVIKRKTPKKPKKQLTKIEVKDEEVH